MVSGEWGMVSGNNGLAGMRIFPGLNLSTLAGSAQQPVVVGVGADPEPKAVIVPPDAERAMMEADTGRPEAADALETKRGMMRVILQEREVLVRQPPNFRLKPVVMRPEGGVRAMVQRGRVRPAAWSASASSASLSSLPASTS